MILPHRRKRDTFLPFFYFIADGVVVYLFIRAAFWMRFECGRFAHRLAVTDFPVYFRSFILIVILVLFFLRYYGLYRARGSYAAEAAKIVKAVFAATLLLTAITFFVRDFSFSRTFLVIAGAFVALGLLASRALAGWLVTAADKARQSYRNILVLGADENGKKIAAFYRAHPRMSTRVVGFLDDRLEPGAPVDEETVVWGRIADLESLLTSKRYIHEVILSVPKVSNEELLKIVYQCERRMVTFRWIADVFGLIASKMEVSYTAGVPILSFVDSPLGEWENRILKRLMDISLSGTALILLAPVFAVIAALVKADSKGPVFYKQQRIGENGRRFFLYKFRTMNENAETGSGPVWATENDPRRTKLGSFLRKNNLDELPQFWNVFIGDMSLVGPRPERPFFVSQFQDDIPRYMARHTIRSGITGWAQVNGLRGNTSIAERTKYDLFYIENWSLALDVKILFMTLFARRNAY